MNGKEKKKSEIVWYDNPNLVTTIIIGLIAVIVILSQSFAINSHLSAVEILSSILNHNIVYLLMFVYFVGLKTRIGKKYFDFFNLFIIVLHSLTAITSLLTVFQSFGLSSLLILAIDVLIIIFMFHTFLRSTRVWKSMGLAKSPFNDISNSGYFSSILVLVMTLLAVNLISTTSFDGTVLALLDSLYTILFSKYIFLYGEYLNDKNATMNKSANFNELKEEFSDKKVELKFDEKFETLKDDVSSLAGNIKEELVDVKEKIEDSIFNERITEIIDGDVENNDQIINDERNNESASKNKDIKKNLKSNDNIKKGTK